MSGHCSSSEAERFLFAPVSSFLLLRLGFGEGRTWFCLSLRILSRERQLAGRQWEHGARWQRASGGCGLSNSQKKDCFPSVDAIFSIEEGA